MHKIITRDVALWEGWRVLNNKLIVLYVSCYDQKIPLELTGQINIDTSFNRNSILNEKVCLS